MFRVSHHSTSHPPIQTSPILTSCPVGRNYSATHLTFLGSERAVGTLALAIFKCICQTCPKTPLANHTDTHTQHDFCVTCTVPWFCCCFFVFESHRHCCHPGHSVGRWLSSRNSPRQFFLQETWLPWSFPSLTLSWKETHQGIKLSPLNRSAVLSLTRNVSSLTLLSGSGAKPDVTHSEGPSASLGRVIEKKEIYKTSFIYSLQSVI